MSAAIVEMTMPMPTPSANPSKLLMERTTMAALYAPMHINPACPSENCRRHDDQIQRNGQDDVDADVIQRDLIIAADDADVHQKSDQRKDDRRKYDPADIFL